MITNRQYMMRLVFFLLILCAQATISLAGSFIVSSETIRLVDTTFLEAERVKILNQIGFSSGGLLPKIEIVSIKRDASLNPSELKKLPDWMSAFAEDQNNRIVLLGSAEKEDPRVFRQILIHELTHILLYQTENGAFLPRWFHEGLAMTFAGQISWDEQLEISKALFTGRLLTLSEMESVNQFKRAKADLAYAQSHLAISFLTRRYGADVIRDIIEASRRKHNFYRGFFDVLGLNKDEWEKIYRDDLRKEYRFLFVINDTWTYWILAVVFLIIVFIIKKAQNRKTLKKWEQEEKMEEEEDFTSDPPTIE